MICIVDADGAKWQHMVIHQNFQHTPVQNVLETTKN